MNAAKLQIGTHLTIPFYWVSYSCLENALFWQNDATITSTMKMEHFVTCPPFLLKAAEAHMQKCPFLGQVHTCEQPCNLYATFSIM